MSFSKIADTCFTWKINDFKELVLNSNKKIIFSSSNFTTSLEPNRPWYLVLSIIESTTPQVLRLIVKSKRSNVPETCDTKVSKKVDLKLISDKTISDPVDIKVNISIINDFGKIYVRSFLVTGSENKYGFDNFIDFEELTKIILNGQLEIFVEMFLQNEKKNESLEVFTNSRFLSDIQISIKGQKFYAHKVILAAKSRYFQNVFEQNKELNEINNIDNMKPDAFMEILKYIYSNNIDKWCLSCDILLGASFLQMEDLKSECEKYLRNNISSDSVISLLILAVECNSMLLLKHCLYYVVKNFNILGTLGNFQCLKTEPLVVLNILKEIIQNFANGRMRVVYSTRISYNRKAINTNCDLLQDYKSFLNCELLSDITIQVGGKTYSSHKLILAAKSPVLRRMLMSDMKESLNNLIEIEDIKAEVFYEILRYMYTGEIENVQEYASDILKAADKYNLDHLKQVCEEHLSEGLTNENVVEIVKLADTYNAVTLRKRCSYYMIQQMVGTQKEIFNSIITLDTFINSHSNILFEILELLTMYYQFEYD